ncbi:hypothetical protein HNP46_005869 [Pseudomonas nitritireducens]|uniref:Bacterial Ig-like domain-containing protein n=1 Tax=Pseudomonas nitroreducens TaxID=46680 RepID=A0A7W7P3S2_PSENT|nr:Ig-like domain-containing protein [Pseudomonas nitritireducens]MBB4866961.1 hypothetical protein [Pseudomonas nitritireducens]
MSNNPSSLYQRAFSANQAYASDAYSASAYAWPAATASLYASEALQPTVILGARDSSGDLSDGQATQSATPTLFGTGTAGETLQVWATATDSTGVMLAGYPVGKAVVQADGTWQFDVPQVPQSAQYAFQVISSHDQTGMRLNIIDVPSVPPVHHDAVITGAIDHVGPVTGELSSGATTDDTRPTFHGSGTPGELITVNAIAIGADGHPLSNVPLNLGAALVQPDGTWQFNAQQALPQGTYDFYVGQGTESAPFRLVIDTSAGVPQPQPEPQPEPQPDPQPQPEPQPHGGTTLILGVIDDSGSSAQKLNNGSSTHDSTPTLFGTGKAGDVLHLWTTVTDGHGMLVNGFSLGETVVKADGTWQFITSELAQSGHYEFQAFSASGQSAGFHLTLIDAQAPEPVHYETVITGAIDNYGAVTGELANGATTDDTRPVLHGTGTPGELIQISAIAIDADGKPLSNISLGLGTALVQQDGSWHFSPNQALPEGTYNFHAGQGDAAPFRLVIDKHSLLHSSQGADSDYAQHLQGQELDLGSHLSGGQPAATKGALPALGSLLESGEPELRFAGHAEASAPVVPAQHHAAAEFRPALLDELVQPHVVI